MRFLFFIPFSILFLFSCGKKAQLADSAGETIYISSEENTVELGDQEQLRQIFIAQFLEMPLDSVVSIPHQIVKNIGENTFISTIRKGQKMKVGEEHSVDVIFHHYNDSYDDTYFVVFQKGDDFFLAYSPINLAEYIKGLLRGDTITLHLSSKEEPTGDSVSEYVTGLGLKAKGKYARFLDEKKNRNIQSDLIDLESEISYALSSINNIKIQKIVEADLPIEVEATEYSFAVDDDRIPNNESVQFYHAKLYSEGRNKAPFVELLISTIAQDGDNLSIYVMEDAKPDLAETRKIKRISIY